MTLGKNYRKDHSIQGAALFYLSLERSGAVKMGGAKEIIKDTFAELGVTKDQVEQYIAEKRAELEDILEKRFHAAADVAE